MSTLAAEYGLAEQGVQLLEDMRLKVMEDRGEHKNHSYDGLLGIIRVPQDDSTEERRYPYLSALGWEELRSDHPLELEDLQLLVGIRGQRTEIEYLTQCFSYSDLEIVIDAGDHAKPLEAYCLAPKTFELLPGNILIIAREGGQIVGVPKDEIEWYISQICVNGDLPISSVRETVDYCRGEVVQKWQEELANASGVADYGPDALAATYCQKCLETKSIEDAIYSVYNRAIAFFGLSKDKSEEFYISQKVPGNPDRSIPSFEIEQVADRITINELTPDGFVQVYASHQEHPKVGWMQCPDIGLSLNDLERIERILDGKVDLSTGIDSLWTTDNADKKDCQTNTFWITHEASYLKSKMTCVKTTRTHTQAKLDAYYIIYEGYDHYEINDVEPLPESVCHLLVKFFGYEICEYDDSAIEIDLLYIWQGPRDPDIKVGNKSWYLWLNLSRFRWGFYPELMRIMDGRLNVDRLPQYPWNSQYESVTGWDCGEYIIEVAFNLFNSQSEAEEFGESCYALAPYEEYCNLLKLLYIDPYGDEERTPIRKDDTKVFLSSSVFDIRSGDLRDRDEWELVSLDVWDTPNLVIGAQLYCHGRDREDNQELGQKVQAKEEVAAQIVNEDHFPDCIQQDLDNHLAVELIDVKQGTLTRQLRATIRDVVVDVEIGYETITGEFKTLDDVEPSIIEAIAKDPRFTELIAISSGMIEYPYVQYPDFSNVNRLDSGDELKRFVESRAYKLGEQYGSPSTTEDLIEKINTRHSSEVEVYQSRIRNNAVNGIPFKPSKFQGGKIDQSGRLCESYISVGEIYIDDQTRNLELPIRIGSEEFTMTVGVETQNGTSYRFGDSLEPIQGITQDQRFNELVAATAGTQNYPYTHNLDFRHPEKLTAEELQSIINHRAEILGENYGVRIMGESSVACVGTTYAALRGTTREALLQSFVDPTKGTEQQANH